MDELGDIIQEFLVESHENLDQLDRDLVALEQQPGSRELLSSIFRTIHTIKGTSGFLAFHRLESLTHAGESLLSRLRDGSQVMTPATTDTLLRMVDTVRNLLTTIENEGAEGDVEIDSVLAMVQACIEDGTGKPSAPKAAKTTKTTQPAESAAPAESAETTQPAETARPAETAAPAEAEETPQTAQTAPPATAGTTEVAADPAPEAAPAVTPQEPGAEQAAAGAADDRAEDPADEREEAHTEDRQDDRRPQPEHQPAPEGSPMNAGTEAPASPSAATATASAPASGAPGSGSASAAPARRGVAESSIRVDVDMLDALMRLVGELVLTRNQIVRAVGEISDAALVRTTQRLNLITSELQESVMKTRMQPIDNLWSKLPRVVRDLSSACGNQVKLKMEGKETELDRSLLEAVKDPLTHLVRNAVDHGIEPPEVRQAAGKDPVGTLTLRAYHEGGHVIVEISDDGKGIDHEKVGAAALQRNLVTRDQLSRMEPRDIVNLVFHPGFSTAEKVTNVSGRGVGMDVVKTNIDQIGGSVDIETVIGRGTTWRLTIPLTLAIIQALTVECGSEQYAIPQVGVDELVFVDRQSDQPIEWVSGAAVYRLRGKLLPLVRLDETLGLEAGGVDTDVYIVVLQADGRRFGLVVDRVLNTEEIVVKPLSARLKDVGAYAGATITGDGRVALILDTASLARRSHLNMENSDHLHTETVQGARSDGNIERLLIAGVGERRVAIPLDAVTRLEEFSVDRLERVGSREVVQYREHILPVVRLADLLGAYGMEDEERTTVPAIVYTEHGRSVALIVQQIHDIVDDVIEERSDLDDDGLIGSTVIQDRVTELLDVRRAILAADPRFFTETAADPNVDLTVGV